MDRILKHPLGVAFKVYLLIIFTVSLIDIYWSIKLAETLPEEEQNPMGRWLIHMDNDDIALFMTLKVVGTFIVIWALIHIYHIQRDIAHICAIALTIFQIGLILYFLMPF